MTATQHFDTPAAAAASDALAVTVTDDFGSVRDAYERLADQSGAPAPQSPHWIETYEREVGGHFVHASVSDGGKTRMILALERVRRRGIVTLRFAGGCHANANFPAIDTAWKADPEALHRALADGIRAACPDIDALVLERQLDTHQGIANPLVTVRSTPSPNLALAADLAHGFDGLLSEISGKRKRKKHRSQTRKFEAAGGFRLARAESEDDIDRAFDAFFDMKETRFRAAGIENVFAAPEFQTFLRALFKAELGKPAPRFVIDTLEVAGKLRAVAAESVSGERMTCEFASIAEDDMAFASPGEFLFFHAIKTAAEDGFAIYDFGVGDEHYKRLWCRLETVHHDTVIALTAKGEAYRLVWSATAAAKRRVKNSTVLWPLVKRLRQSLRGSGQADTTSSDSDD